MKENRRKTLSRCFSSFSCFLVFIWSNTLTYEIRSWLISRKMKYILVTGGVISGIGKGIISSSVGTILRSYGFRVTSIKVSESYERTLTIIDSNSDRSLYQYRCRYFFTVRTWRSIRIGWWRVSIDNDWWYIVEHLNHTCL